MTIAHTDLNDTRERARNFRFEPIPGIPNTNMQTAIEAAVSPAIISTPVAVGASPYAPLATDQYLYVDTSGGAITIQMPLGSARGTALVIKDVTGNASTNNITILPTGVELIDGLASLVINADFGGYRLNPRSGSGYTVSP